MWIADQVGSKNESDIAQILHRCMVELGARAKTKRFENVPMFHLVQSIANFRNGANGIHVQYHVGPGGKGSRKGTEMLLKRPCMEAENVLRTHWKEKLGKYILNLALENGLP